MLCLKNRLNTKEEYINERNLKPMLAYNYEPFPENTEFVLTPKIDGNRMILIKIGNQIKCLSRNLKEITNIPEIEKEALQLPNGIYDGELQCDNFIRTQGVLRSDGVKKNLIYTIFDIMTNQQAFSRKMYILKNVPNLKHIKPIDVLCGSRHQDIIPEYLDWAIENGYEGLMINLVNAPYIHGRTKNLLKVKKMKTIDLPIIDFQKGTGKNKDTLGAIICGYKDSTVKVGSGFTDNERDYIWDNRLNLKDVIVEVKYFEETENSLRFPTFVRLRYDK